MKRYAEEAYRKPNSQSSSSGEAAVKRPCSKQKLVYNRPKPDVLQSILRSKANPEYNSRRLWYELNMPECTSEILDGRMLSTTVPESLLGHTKEMRSKRRKQTKKKEKRPSYMQMRLERENFRKKLVELIARKEDDADDDDESVGAARKSAIDLEADFPNKDEKEVLRYYYYIKHGIDTIHVSPMSKKVLNRIKSQIPPVLNKWTVALNENIDEISSDFVFAMKKAVIDFVLQNSLKHSENYSGQELTAERKYAKNLLNKYRYRLAQPESPFEAELLSQLNALPSNSGPISDINASANRKALICGVSIMNWNK